MAETPAPAYKITRRLQTDWFPLLDGALRDRALEAVLAIADALSADGISSDPRSASEPDAASLAGGDAGLAIFFTSLAEAGFSSHGLELAERFLDRAQSIVATAPMTPSLYSGFTGVVWGTQHLTGRIFDADDDPNEATRLPLDRLKRDQVESHYEAG